MPGFWKAEAQEIAYDMLLDGKIILHNNVDKFQLLRSIASWSELECIKFVDAYPIYQRQLLRAELPGPSTEPELPRSPLLKFQKGNSRIYPGTGRDLNKLSATPKFVKPVSSALPFCEESQSMAPPLTGWLPQDDAQAYLRDEPMEEPGQKRKRISAGDTAATLTSSAPASAIPVYRIILQTERGAVLMRHFHETASGNSAETHYGTMRSKPDPSGKGKGKMSDLEPLARHGGRQTLSGFGKGRTCSSLEFAWNIINRNRDDADLEALMQPSRLVRQKALTLS